MLLSQSGSKTRTERITGKYPYPRSFSSSSYYPTLPPSTFLSGLRLRTSHLSIISSLCKAGEKHLSPQFKKKPRVTEVTYFHILFQMFYYGTNRTFFASSVQIFLKVRSICPMTSMNSYWLAEVQIMRGMNHPSIVKLISFSESSDYYFLVLERKQLCSSKSAILVHVPF